MKIKWTNIHSGEQGYVKNLNRDRKDFVSTDSADEAGKYAAKRLDAIIKALQENQPQNKYEIVED